MSEKENESIIEDSKEVHLSLSKIIHLKKIAEENLQEHSKVKGFHIQRMLFHNFHRSFRK